jgi:hypothetical protein
VTPLAALLTGVITTAVVALVIWVAVALNRRRAAIHEVEIIDHEVNDEVEKQSDYEAWAEFKKNGKRP